MKLLYVGESSKGNLFFRTKLNWYSCSKETWEQNQNDIEEVGDVRDGIFDAPLGIFREDHVLLTAVPFEKAENFHIRYFTRDFFDISSIVIFNDRIVGIVNENPSCIIMPTEIYEDIQNLTQKGVTMTDRFKFRCWDKENKKFLDDLSFDLSANGTLILCGIEGRKYINLNDNNRYLLMQSTGLKDKNGKLIYENDRVKFIWHGKEFEGTVIWYLSSWGIKIYARFIRLEEDFNYDDPKNIEIIGNIHEMEDKMTYCKNCGADFPPNKQVGDVKEILHKEYIIDYLNEIFEDIESSICNEDYSEDGVFEVSVKYRKQ